MSENPIIDEIRSIRKKMDAEIEKDPDAFLARMKEIEKKWPAGVVTRKPHMLGARKAA